MEHGKLITFLSISSRAGHRLSAAIGHGETVAQRHAGSWKVTTFLGLLAMATLACARDAQIVRWESDLYYTEQLYIDGQTTLASSRFQTLRRQAVTPRDADEAAFSACEVLARGGQFPEATACYDALALDAATPATRARGVLYAAELRMDHLQQPRQALALLLALMRKAPSEAAALRAVDLLTLHGQKDSGKRAQVIELFLELEHEAPQSDLADNFLFRAAVLLSELQQPAADLHAIALLERNESLHTGPGTLMDSMQLHAELLHRRGDSAQEAVVLGRIIETYETSYVFASYAGPYHSQAFERIIALYRGPLKDLAKAELYAKQRPNMLHHPLELPQLMMVVADIQEERGHLRDAMHTCEALLAEMAERHVKMHANDQRICQEMEEQAERSRCLKDIEQLTEPEHRDVGRARQTVTRLQAQLRAQPVTGAL